MDLSVNAKRFYREEKIPAAFNPDETFEKINGLNERLRLVFINRGTAILNIDGKRISVVSPAVVCINEKEDINLEDSLELSAQTFYFHPKYINGNLNFDKIRGFEEDELLTNRQDIFLFKPFVLRDEGYLGILNIDPITMENLSSLLNSVITEFEEQSHRHWSCRARSYFLEILFVIVRIFESPEGRVNNIINNSSKLIDKVILYLNSNYGSKITIQELCSMFNTNRTTLQQQFHNAAGKSIMSYLITLRVKLSMLMLKDTSLTVFEIAERTGFSDSTHFNKIFSKHTGYSPLQYRKQYTWIK